MLCYHTADDYYFLPKGRKDVNEPLTTAAEREGFEESGYRCRLLPLPIVTSQTQPARRKREEGEGEGFVTEPLWTQTLPLTREKQYFLFWYVGETLPPDLEEEITKREKEQGNMYQSPPEFERGVTLQKRVMLEGKGYEPVRHEGTGVDKEELLYTSILVSVEEAIISLGSEGVTADVVRRGWELIRKRWIIEEEALKGKEDSAKTISTEHVP